MYQIFLDKVKKHLDHPSRNRLLQDIHDKQYPEFIIDLALFKKLRAYLSFYPLDCIRKTDTIEANGYQFQDEILSFGTKKEPDFVFSYQYLTSTDVICSTSVIKDPLPGIGIGNDPLHLEYANMIHWFHHYFVPTEKDHYLTPYIPFQRNHYIHQVRTSLYSIIKQIIDSKDITVLAPALALSVDFVFEMHNVINTIDIKELNNGVSFFKRDNFRINFSDVDFSLNWHGKSLYSKEGKITYKEDDTKLTLDNAYIAKSLHETLLLAMISTYTGCDIIDHP